jgi:V-type H+-transporting ATPase subunit H
MKSKDTRVEKWPPFHIINKHNSSRDTVLADKGAAMLSGVMCRYPQKFTDRQVIDVCNYSGSEYGKLEVVANLLKFDGFRESVWVANKARVVSALESGVVPTVYKGLTCLWLAGFNKYVIEKGVGASLVAKVNAVLQTNRTEKVVRVALQAVGNLLKSKAMCEAMAECDLVSTVSALEVEKWRDSELVSAISELVSKLNQEVKLLTNFERFEREVMSGNLKWGFIHSESFWRENVSKCEANNFRVIDHLMTIVRNRSSSAESLAVACHDLGEFARLHPVGKQIATNKGAKDKMLELMSNSQREVAREALLCVQKLMLQKAADLQAIQAM